MHVVSYVRGRGISFLYVHKILIVLLTRDIAFRRLSLWDWDPVVVWAPPARQQQEDHALAVSPLSPTCSHRITWPAPRDHPFAVYAQVDLSTTLLVEPVAAMLLPPTAVRLFYWLRPVIFDELRPPEYFYGCAARRLSQACFRDTGSKPALINPYGYSIGSIILRFCAL
jgi:hypothetical protein